MVFLVVFLCIANLLLWLLFLLKFKKLFSTEDIIEKTKNELNKLVRDINNNTDRNVTIYNECSRNLKNLISETERKIELLENRLRLLNDEQKKNNLASVLQNTVTQKKNSSHKMQDVANAYKMNEVSPKSYSITESGREVVNNSEQKILFDDNNSTISTVANVTVNTNGTSYAEIPIVVPSVFAGEIPVDPKKELKIKVIKLYEQGSSVEEIASTLGCSVVEVQYIIDFTDNIL